MRHEFGSAILEDTAMKETFIDSEIIQKVQDSGIKLFDEIRKKS